MPTSVGDTYGLPLTADAAQSTTDGQDFYFFVLSKNAISLLYGSYMGEAGGAGEHVDGGTSRFDKNGIVYQAICGGCGGSSAFPTTPGVWSNTNNGGNCNEIALKIAFNLGSVVAHANANPSTTGCAPLTVNFSNGSVNATSYTWTFGDGSPTSSLATPSHVFTAPGVYSVRLVAYNPNACKEYDTVYLSITVMTNSMTPNFTYGVTDSCGPYTVSFNNTSVFSATPSASTFTRFLWIFGDGTTFSGNNPGTHNYPDTGTYTIQFVMIDSTACNSPDTLTKIVNIHSNRMIASFNVPDSLCTGSIIQFSSQSTNATTTLWTFGDGGTSSTASPSHQYNTSGNYIVTLVVSNPNSCNKIDSMHQTLTISESPVAAFSFTPIIPQPNDSTTFTNLSVRAVSYEWDFGDGFFSGVTNPVHFYHVTGMYTVCLTARSVQGCPDKTCKKVPADIVPVVDLPTAFTPNGDHINDILFVRGAAIASMDLKIFNRWGENVFETTDQNVGWDGTFNGKPQEMDAFAYVLNVTFFDGTTVLKKGNVTLIR
jgi:gliding motility-associated-like protein